MEKMQVRTLAELVAVAERAGVVGGIHDSNRWLHCPKGPVDPRPDST